MNRESLTIFSAAVMLLLGFLIGCEEAKKQIADAARELTDSRAKGPMHQRLKWKAEDFFADADVRALCKAIEAKDIKEIERLVKLGVDLNAQGRANMTPLLWAFPMGEDVFGKMLELGADPNIRLTENHLLLQGKSVTFAAVELVDGLIYSQYFYDVHMDNYLNLVLEHGGDPNVEDLSGDTPLFCVRRNIRRVPEKIQLLLDAGADINHRNHQGATPLASAVGRSHICVLCLLKSGADYRIVDNKGLDPILRLDARRRLARERAQQQCDYWAGPITQPIYDWLAQEGVDWKAARAALESPDTLKNLKDLPADYRHRPWLPQRPTLKKPDAEEEDPQLDRM